MADASSEGEGQDYSTMKVADLKRELKARGLSTAGNKTDLLERLQLAQQGIEADVSLAETESNAVDSEEMLDEDDVLADEDVLEDEIADIDKSEESVEATSTVKRKSEEDPETVPERKKIVLNRTRPLSTVEEPEADREVDNSSLDVLRSDSVVDQQDENKNKNIIKISSLTAKDRLEMRARKFGVTALSTDAKKAARAARFGLESSNTIPVSSDVLKKRAERFGLATSTTVTEKKVDEDKLKKREERFSEAKPSNKTKITFSSSPVSSASSLSLEERKKLRAERFKVGQ
ncbi:SAP domain-containing ribonucleoprotein [Bacillus rossius redtenbacheri]|uniref:SAP domain-containing ribonucleoprotein n=1 Tax=Bacillus rossius redtenbacheri TaxID=93214 RepID=UPI002FDD6D3B